MNRKLLDGITITGLIISGVAVADLLIRWNTALLVYIDLAWGIVCATLVGLVLLASKVRQRFQTACQGGSRLLGLRLLLAVVLMVLGWYINAASEALYGADSPMVADNGVRMFCVIFTAVFHVIYFAYTKKKTES